MKKNLLLILAALSAGAISVNAQTVQKVDNQAELESATAEFNGVISTVAVEKAASEGELFTSFDWSYKSCLANNVPTSGKITLTKGTEANEVIITGLYGKTEFKGTYDLAAGTITIPQTTLGKTSEGYYAVFEIFDWSGDQPVATTQSLVLTYKGGTLNLSSPYTVVGIGAHKDSATGTLAGYYLLTTSNRFWNLTWKELGKTQYTDGFFSPMFGQTPAAKEVTVYKAESGLDIYKVENALSLVASGANPMYIDATDANHVAVPVQNSGITATGRGLTWYCSYSEFATSPSNFSVDNYKKYNITMKDGVISIPAQAARFSWTEYTGNIGSWYYNGKTVATTLTIPGGAGIDDIVAEDENAPVEYYNLQGIRVNEPVSGSLVIRRQGSKASKIIVK